MASPLSVFASSNSADGALGGWTNPTYAYNDDGVQLATRAGTAKNTWYGTLFGFDLSSIPDGSIIDTVTLSAEWKNSAADSSGPVLLLGEKHGGVVGGNAQDTSGQTTFEVLSYAPTGLTTADLKATGANGFWAVLRFERTDNTAHTASVDYVKCVVEYHTLAQYSLDAECGSFALTGQNLDLQCDYNQVADVGAFILTGIAASLDYYGGPEEYSLDAETGAFVLNGQDTELVHDNILSAETGEYSLTGQDTGLVNNVILGAETGTFSLSGIDNQIILSSKLNAETQTYNLTGQDASLPLSNVIEVACAVFSLAGQDTTLLFDRTLVAETGAFTFSGLDAQLDYSGGTPEPNNYELIAEPGSFVMNGQEAILSVGYFILFATGSFILEGQDASLNYSGAEAGILIYERGIAVGLAKGLHKGMEVIE